MKRIISAILLATILGALLLSCGNTNEGTTTAANSTTAASTGETTTKRLEPDLPAADLKGEEYKFYVMSKERNVNNYSMEIYAEAENGEPVNDAVYARNVTLQEKYNFKLTEMPEKASDLAATVLKNLQAGDDIYQVFMMNLAQSNNLARQGYLADLNQVENIDLSKPWWDANSNEGFSVLGKTFYAVGDINIMDNNATWACFFNKKILKDLAIDLPYKNVLDSTWTIDKFSEMAKAACKDLNGNGTMDMMEDRWGNVSDNMNSYMLWVGAGESITKKDKDGGFVFNMFTERGANIINKIIDVQSDANVTILAEKTGHATAYPDVLRKNFKNDQALFYVAGMLSFTLLRDMESEYGMVPLPKYDSNQAEYHTTYNYNNASSLSIPVTNKRLSETGLIVEALSAESMYTLTPAYYDIALERKYMRDEESREMLKIILDSRSVDLAYIGNWAGCYSIFGTLTSSGSKDFASSVEKIKDAFALEVDKVIADFEKIK